MVNAARSVGTNSESTERTLMPDLDKKEIVELCSNTDFLKEEKEVVRIDLEFEKRKSLRGTDNPFWEAHDGLD